MKKFTVTLLIFIVSSTATIAAGSDWNLVTSSDGIKVWNRKKAGTSLKEAKCSGLIKAEPWRVLKVVTDFDHYSDFMPYTKESRLLKRKGKVFQFYTRVAPPLITDRDYTLELVSSLVDGKDGYFMTKFSQANSAGPPKREGIVRVEVVSGYWLMEPVADGKHTLLTYYVFTAPGGAVPDALANRANSQSLPGIIKAVRGQARLSQYDCREGNPENCQDWREIVK